MGMKLGSSFAIGGYILLVLASIAEKSVGARIVVGGSEHWHFGFNYTDWAIKTAPFYKNDTLVFMYDPPSNTTFPHSVYLLKNVGRFLACDLRKATLVGNVSQGGGGEGMEFVLKKRKTHYFACGERAGMHCKLGLMRFMVHPLKPCNA